MSDPAPQDPSAPGSVAPAVSQDPNDGIWPYLGVGCITLISGFFGGGMIAVLVAKIVGASTGCAPDPETGAPCNWFTYMLIGALIGLVAFPTTAVFLLRRSRLKHRNKV
jgi:hypothetical protein